MSDQDGRCQSCAAFSRAWDHPQLGRVGDCNLAVYPPPVRATSTCSRYRPKGAAQAAVKPRAAGEPRRNRRTAPTGDTPPRIRTASAPARRPLPQEIDIDMDINEFRSVLREVIADELGITEVELGRRWEGGEMVRAA